MIMRILTFILLLSISRVAVSAQCSDVFPTALQSHSGSGVLTVNSGVKVNGLNSTVLPFVSGIINASAGDSCGNADCSVSGFASEPLNISSEFPSFSGDSFSLNGATLGEGIYNTNVFGFITAASGTTDFSNNFSTYFLNGLTIQSGAVVNLKPGTYWVKDLILNSSNSVNDIGVNVEGNGVVYLYANNVTVNSNRVLNGLKADIGLNIGVYQNFTFNSNATGSGLVYSIGNATFNSGSEFTGVVSAANLTLNSNSTINYSTDLFVTYDFSATCDSDVPASRRAFYEFDQTGWNGAGTVVDSSGNGFNGSPLGSVSPLSYSGSTCLVLDVPANTSSGTVDAVDTGIDINDVGNVGSISFWYRSDLAWSDSTGRQLFDASNQAPSPDKYFFLSLDSGALQFGVEDENDGDISVTRSGLNFAANEWVHITAVWNLPNNSLSLYLNTANSSSASSASQGGIVDGMGDYDTLYIGDSRSDYFVGISTDNSAHGQFENFEIYNYALTSNEARTNAGSTPSCGTQDTELVAHWPMNVCSLDGTPGEVIDVIAGANGSAIDGASIDEAGQLCQASEYAGNGQHINIPHDNAFEISNGSLSMWFQVYDLNHSNDSSRDALALFSKDSTGTDNGGDHLTIYVSTNGSINARHQSSSSSFYALSASGLVSENQWHHLVYTFGSGGVKIYLDKQLVATNGYTGGLSGNPEPIILGSGAWRTGNNESAPADLFDHFIGKIDDVRLYQGELDSTEIDALYDQTDNNCTDCPNDDVLEAHWPLDVCSLDGTSDEILDVINGYNGASVDGAAILEDGKFCQSGDFSGSGDHLNIPNVSAFEAGKGAVSFWFNAADLSHSNTTSQGGQGLFSRDSTGYDNGGHVTIWLQPNGSFRVRHQDTSSNNEINTGVLASANTWHHLVYTWGSDGMRLYLDGALVGSNVNFTQGTVGNSEPIIFAANAWQTGNSESLPTDLKDFFQGQIDEIKFYSTQIDSSTVSDLFAESSYDCTSCNNDILVAQYQFEQDSWSGNGAVTDNSNSGNNANHLGSVLPIAPSEQIACRAMEVPASSERTSEYNAIDTTVDINSLGNKGSISFWYRSNENWNSGNARQLFDASTDLGNYGDSKYFYLAINTSGQLDFNMEDVNDDNFGASTTLNLSYAAEEWVHVAVTWDLRTEQIAIYLNGVAQALNDNSDSNLSNTLGDLDTLYIGDNRSDYLVVTSTQNSANGEFDDVRIYNYVQDSTQVNNDKDSLTTCSFVYKYLIEHDGTGLTCEAEPVIIKACANESCSELYDQDVTVDMSPNTGWPDGSSVTILADTPATVELSQLTAGTVSLEVLNETTECTGTASNTCDMVFADAGFQFIGADANSVFPDQIAESAFSSAQLRAVRTENNAGVNVCTAALEGDQTLTFGMSCDDPDLCLTGIQVGNVTISEGNTSDVVLNFNSDGIASLGSFSYADAGQISLSVQGELAGAGVVNGATQFVVQPDRLEVEILDPNAFQRAGIEYEVQLKALGTVGANALPNYQPGNMQFALSRTSPIGDGTFDGVLTYAQSATINVTETSAFANSVITHTNANVTNNDGVYRFSAEYSEFGQVVLDVRDSNYFNRSITSASAGTSSPITLGLFIPAYFDVSANAPQLADTCSGSNGFTYLGQNTSFIASPQLVVSAMNAKGQITQNYNRDNDWLWLTNADPAAIELTDPALNGSVTLASSPTMNVSAADAGTRLLVIDDAQINYSKSIDPYAAFAASMTMTYLPSFITDGSFGNGFEICYHQAFDAADDCDTATSFNALDDTNNVVQMPNITGTEYRWGRLRIENGFGPETEDLLLAVSTEYFDGIGFVLNTDDNCTSLDLDSSDFVLQDSNGIATGAISVLDSEFGVSSGQTLGFEGIRIHNNDTSVMGEYRIELQPVGDATITWDDYLSFDWNGTEDGIGNPSATISFGQFRGNDRVIHWREVGN